jgi:AcrR family transcriptional regulator
MYMVVQQKRKYEQKRRAELQEETRQRIVEATAGLHREVGPAKTTISAVAERAGVQRLTVYRHFADERSLIRACSAHWRAQHPPPDPSAWPAIADPEERLRTALSAWYAYYATDEAMMGNVRRDAQVLPALAEVISDLPRFMAMVVDILAASWGARGARRSRLVAALGHVLAFDTWRSLERTQGLAPAAAVETAVAMVRGVAGRQQ